MPHKELEFNSILPGQLFEGNVVSRKAGGLIIRVGTFSGYAHVTHLSQHVKDFTVGVKVQDVCYDPFNI